MFSIQFDSYEEEKIIKMIVDAYVDRIFKKREYIREEAINKLVGEVREEVLHSDKMDQRVEKIMVGAAISLQTRVNKKFNRLERDIEKSVQSGLSFEAKNLKDTLICTLIGYQNEMGNDESSPEYQAYQRVLEKIESDYGALMK